MRHHAFLLPLVLLHQHPASASHHIPKGQCPLRVPDEFSSTSPIDYRRHVNKDSNDNNNIHEREHERIQKRPPLLAIGHRGTSYNVPEHTLEGFRLALELRADYLEMDLVPTKDRVLVAMHDIDLNRTTDVSRKFPDRFRNVTVTETGSAVPRTNGDNSSRPADGTTVETGYYVMDFTLAEIKTLRVRQGIEDSLARSRLFDWHFAVPTFGEIVDLLHGWNADVRPLIDRGGRQDARPGLYVELKKPRRILEDSGMKVADLLLDELRTHPHAKHVFFGVVPGAPDPPSVNGTDTNGTNGTDTNATTPTTPPETDFGCERSDEYHVPPLVVQCFESAVLESLRVSFLDDDGRTFNHAQPPLVYLVNRRRCRDPTFWYDVAGLRIDGIGPEKECLIGPAGGDARSGRGFMISAEEHNLAVHPWTERLEDEFAVDAERYGTAEDELRYMYCELGVHGIFAENVDVAVRVGLRGCDDFRDVSELIKDEIKIEEEEGGTEGTKRICPHYDSNESASIGLACVLVGMFAGSLVAFWMTSRYYVRKYAIVSLQSNSHDYL